MPSNVSNFQYPIFKWDQEPSAGIGGTFPEFHQKTFQSNTNHLLNKRYMGHILNKIRWYAQGIQQLVSTYQIPAHPSSCQDGGDGGGGTLDQQSLTENNRQTRLKTFPSCNSSERNWEYHLHWSGLGDGWAAAILNSVDELRFLWAINMQINGAHEYTGVGGSTNSNSTTSNLDFSDYLPDDTGELCIHKYIILPPTNELEVCVILTTN